MRFRLPIPSDFTFKTRKFWDPEAYLACHTSSLPRPSETPTNSLSASTATASSISPPSLTFDAYSGDTIDGNNMSPWKEASSLIVVAKVDPQLSPDFGSNGQKFQSVLPLDDCNYRILMAKRSGKSSYMANAFVFPGGHIEVADFSPKWYPVFESMGVSRDALNAFADKAKGPRPPIITETILLKDLPNREELLITDVALRIAAIRETFEETGIPLLTRGPQQGSKSSAFSESEYAKVDLVSWQKKVHDEPELFPEFCLEVGLCPDIWSLHEWWNWKTPETLGHKRFDTIFYICCLDYLPKALSDDQEVSVVEWFSPLEMLEQHTQGQAFLAPPQVYELSRLCNFNSYDQVKDFARKREKHGIECWCANITGLKDGAILALPGDDYYEQHISTKHLPTLEEVRMRSSQLNRLELRAPIFTAVSTIKLTCGHLTPVSHPHVANTSLLTANL